VDGSLAKILYIAGYGRSGSTLLDIVLGNHPENVGVGEVSFLLNEWANRRRRCSCGVPYEECEFWKDLFLDSPPTPELTQLVRKLEALSFIPRLLLGLVTNGDREIYREYQTRLFDYITNQSKQKLVIDSSKSARGTAGRVLALSRLAGQDVYVVHLVRNGLATMESLLITGRNWAIEGHMHPAKWLALRASLGWVFANVWASLIGRLLGPGRCIRLRYEDFVSDPATSTREIAQLCGFDAERLVKRINDGDYFPVGHRVGGNRVRLQGAVKIERKHKQPCGDLLKLNHRLLFALMGGWLHRHYGYGSVRPFSSQSLWEKRTSI
jgi:Sulfotransferase family